MSGTDSCSPSPRLIMSAETIRVLAKGAAQTHSDGAAERPCQTPNNRNTLPSMSMQPNPALQRE